MVAELFCHKLDGNDVVNHIDNDRLNNHYTNLEWTTVNGNNSHRHKQGRSSGAKGINNGRCKLSDNEVLEIKCHLKNGIYNQTELGTMYNVHSSTIYKIKNIIIR